MKKLILISCLIFNTLYCSAMQNSVEEPIPPSPPQILKALTAHPPKWDTICAALAARTSNIYAIFSDNLGGSCTVNVHILAVLANMEGVPEDLQARVAAFKAVQSANEQQ